MKAEEPDCENSAAARTPARGLGAAFVFAAALAIGIHPIPAAATEGGSTNKALGVDTVLTGVMPPPGMRLTTYLGYYTADETLDGNGDPRPNLSNFHLNATAMTLRFQYVYPNAKLFGADIETRLGVTLFGDVDVHFDVQTPVGSLHRTGSANGAFPAGCSRRCCSGGTGKPCTRSPGWKSSSLRASSVRTSWPTSRRDSGRWRRPTGSPGFPTTWSK